MFKQKVVANVIILTLLFGLVLQAAVFGISISYKKNFSGTVYASTGVAIAGAYVSASGEGYGSAQTDAAGHYLIDAGLPTGSYRVMVYKLGYVGAEVENVNVTAGIETPGVNLYLNASGAISGKITDNATGTGITNIFVSAGLSSGGGTFGGFATTDSAGNYEMNTNLATGTYNVTVFFPTGYIGATRSFVSVTGGARTTGIDLSLQGPA